MTMATLFIVLMLTVTVQCHDYVMSREQLTHEVKKLEEKGHVLAYQMDTLKREKEELAGTVKNLTTENRQLMETVASLSQAVDDIKQRNDKGVMGGSPHSESGGAANRVCLTTEPVFDGMPADSAPGRLTGVQYYIHGHRHTDALCAVCYTQHSATFMVPGTNRCPAGTVPQYNGYLTSTYYKNTATAEFLCLDGAPEDRMGSQAQDNRGAYIEHAVTECGSLPCPPYVNGKVATCVVCSK